VAAVHRKLPLPKPRIMHHISQGQGQQSDAPSGVSPAWLAIGSSFWLPRNRMRETFTSGSVGRAPGNRCLYPEPDCLQPPLLRRFGFRRQVSASVRPCGRKATPQDREASQPPLLACHPIRTRMRRVDQKNIFL
jgi:hypothetical protein